MDWFERNLQETMIFFHEISGFPLNFPLHQSIDPKFQHVKVLVMEALHFSMPCFLHFHDMLTSLSIVLPEVEQLIREDSAGMLRSFAGHDIVMIQFILYTLWGYNPPGILNTWTRLWVTAPATAQLVCFFCRAKRWLSNGHRCFSVRWASNRKLSMWSRYRAKSDHFEDVSDQFLGAVLGEVRNNDNNGHQIRDIWVLLISFHQKSMIYYDLIFDHIYFGRSGMIPCSASVTLPQNLGH